MFKNCLLLIILATLPGCTEMMVKIGVGKPASLSIDPPPGSPIYQQGYTDGCESGYSGYGNSYNKLFFKWKQDPQLAQDPVYYQIWKDAYSYCAFYGMMVDAHGFGNWR